MNLKGPTSDIVVQASVGSAVSAKTIVSGTLDVNGHIIAAPANTESSVEADVFVDAKTHGLWTTNTTTAGLRGILDAPTTAAISISATYGADVHTAAVAATVALDARAKTMTSASVGVSASALQAFLSVETSAQAALDVTLDASTSDAAVSAAVKTNDAAVVSAYQASGISDAQFAAAAQIMTYAYVSQGAQISTAVHNAWRLHAAHARADAEARANAAALAVLAASTSATADAASERKGHARHDHRRIGRRASEHRQRGRGLSCVNRGDLEEQRR